MDIYDDKGRKVVSKIIETLETYNTQTIIKK
ncbi:hypothetical protein LCGC14_1150450 [marine sediment metagenome]|uniref:Uncharacterized protein n=1 Tax=marine sediment metagenome TaxID=412755 RepID=A0A0F9PDR8_9ZZZZ